MRTMVSRRIPRPDNRQFLSDFPNGAAQAEVET
jgi:hypothetical protein